MGKSLIIPGADFSANKVNSEIVWYLDDSVFTNESITWDGYLVNNETYTIANILNGLNNKSINCMKVRKNPEAENAKIKLWHIADSPLTVSVDDPVNIIETKEIYITQEGVGVYEFDTINLRNNETIMMGSYCSNLPGGGAMQYSGGGAQISYRFNTSTLLWMEPYHHSYFEINFGYKR